MTSPEKSVYYDPYDFEIDKDPYPIWKRLRDEHPLYYNEKLDFYALSRFTDVERCSKDWRTYSSARGSVLELIKSGVNMPPGAILFEDPPAHDLHRSLLTSIFSPRRIAALEPKNRAFCASCLDRIGGDSFDFIADIGAHVPMRTIGLLLGIPERDQEWIRDGIDQRLELTHSAPTSADAYLSAIGDQSKLFADYIDWRARNRSDGVITELLEAEYSDAEGKRCKLTRAEILGYLNLLAGAGNETTTRLIGWAGKLLAEHPTQRRMLVSDKSLVPKALEEVLRFEPPSPVQARYVTRDVEHHGHTLPAGSAVLLLTAAANRDERRFVDPDAFDIRRPMASHLSFGYGVHFCLGAALARLEAKVALEEVLARFPEWEIDWAHAVQAHTSTVRGWKSLPVWIRS
jgi:cytochrome P450